MAGVPRDGDRDGRVYDGTKREMPAPVVPDVPAILKADKAKETPKPQSVLTGYVPDPEAPEKGEFVMQDDLSVPEPVPSEFGEVQDAVVAAVRRPPVPNLPGGDSLYLRLKGLWNDPGSGRFVKRGRSTAKAQALSFVPGDAVREVARAKGTVAARVADNRLSRSGIKRGDVVEVTYKNDDYATVSVLTASGKRRKYDVQWARFDEVATTAPVTTGKSPIPTGMRFPVRTVRPPVPPGYYGVASGLVDGKWPEYDRRVPVGYRKIDHSNAEPPYPEYELYDDKGDRIANVVALPNGPSDNIEVLGSRDLAMIEAALDDIVLRRQPITFLPLKDEAKSLDTSVAVLAVPYVHGKTEVYETRRLTGGFFFAPGLEDAQGRALDALTRQRLSFLLDPLGGRPMVVEDDVVVLPDGSGVVRSGGKIYGFDAERNMNLYADGQWRQPWGVDPLDDTPENWEKAVALSGLIRFMSDERGVTGYSSGEVVSAIWNETTIDNGVASMWNLTIPVDRLVDAFARPTDVSQPSTRSFYEMVGQSPAMPRVGDGAQPAKFLDDLPVYGNSVGTDLIATLIGAADDTGTSPALTAFGFTAEDVEMIDDGFAFDRVIHRGPLSLVRRTARGYRPVSAEIHPEIQEDGSPYELRVLMEGDGAPYTMKTSLKSLVGDGALPTEATRDEALRVFVDRWEATGGPSFPHEVGYDAMIVNADVRRMPTYFATVDGHSKRTYDGVRLKVGVGIYPYRFAGEDGYLIAGWDNDSTTGRIDQFFVTKNGTIYGGHEQGSMFQPYDTPVMENATDEQVRSFIFGIMQASKADGTGTPQTIAEYVRKGAKFDATGLEWDGERYNELQEVVDAIATKLLVDKQSAELDALGDMDGQSFTTDGFADLAERALRVAEDTPESELKPVVIDGGGEWASQGTDLANQDAWLSGFPVVDTVLAAAAADTADLPDDPTTLVPVPSWLRDVGVSQIRRIEDGVAYIPAGLVAEASFQRIKNILGYNRNSEEGLEIREALNDLAVAFSYVPGSVSGSGDGNLADQLRFAAEDLAAAKDNPDRSVYGDAQLVYDQLMSDFRDVEQKVGGTFDYRRLVSGALSKLRDRFGEEDFAAKLRAVLLDVQNGQWADSSQSNFSTVQALAAVEIMGATPDDFPEWNQWRTGRARGSGYTVGYSESEMMLARLTALSTYTLTQNTLEQQGIGVGDVTVLARGDSSDTFKAAAAVGQPVRLATNPLASFATRAGTAQNFGGGTAVGYVRVPRSRIFSFAHTGPGTYREWEVVVMGKPDGLTAIVKSTDGPDDETVLRDAVNRYITPEALSLANDFVGMSAEEQSLMRLMTASPSQVVTPGVSKVIEDALASGRLAKSDGETLPSEFYGVYVKSLPPTERVAALQRILRASQNHEFETAETTLLSDVSAANDGQRRNFVSRLMIATIGTGLGKTPLIVGPFDDRVVVWTGDDRVGFVEVTVPGASVAAAQLRSERRRLGSRPSLVLSDDWDQLSLTRDERILNSVLASEDGTPDWETVLAKTQKEARRRSIADADTFADRVRNTPLADLVRVRVEARRAWDARAADLQARTEQLLAGEGDVRQSPLVQVEVQANKLSTLLQPFVADQETKMERIVRDLGIKPFRSRLVYQAAIDAMRGGATTVEQMMDGSAWRFATVEGGEMSEEDSLRLANAVFAQLRRDLSAELDARAKLLAAVAALDTGDPLDRVLAAQSGLDLLGDPPSPPDVDEVTVMVQKSVKSLPSGVTDRQVAEAIVDTFASLSVNPDGSFGWQGNVTHAGVMERVDDLVGGRTRLTLDPMFMDWVMVQVRNRWNWTTEQRTLVERLEAATAALTSAVPEGATAMVGA